MSRVLLFLSLGLALALGARAADSTAFTVEPSELTRRADLVGREVSVDDRVRFFQFHLGRGYDELYLKRTPVVFRLPPRLREVQTSNPKVVQVHGVLRQEGEQWFCDVTALEPLPEDLERVNRGVSTLPPQDAEGRRNWSRWAERRGKAFQDERLLARAAELEGEAIRIEAERRVADPARLALALAERARSRHVPEPEPSALAHQGLQTMLGSAKTAEQLAGVKKQIEQFFPNSPKPPEKPVDLAKWETPYDKNAAATYRLVGPAVRAALDHKLWADATQRLLQAQAAADPRAVGCWPTRPIPNSPTGHKLRCNSWSSGWRPRRATSARCGSRRSRRWPACIGTGCTSRRRRRRFSATG